MRNMVHMPVKGRIAQAFLTLKERFGTDEENTIGIEITRQDLASFAGASYETLFKVIHEFTDEKLIAMSGKSIRITNEDGLKSLAHDISL
jgi:CRP-like cAMP-binding protein